MEEVAVDIYDLKEDPLSMERERRCESWVWEQQVERLDADNESLASDTEIDNESVTEVPLKLPKFNLVARSDNTPKKQSTSMVLKSNKLRYMPGKKIEDMKCHWRECNKVFNDNNKFRAHSKKHLVQDESKNSKLQDFKCLWGTCSYTCNDLKLLTTHLSYHVYHERLVAIGKMFLKTIDVEPCTKKINEEIPLQPECYQCLWGDCKQTFDDIQDYHLHLHLHGKYEEKVCSFNGCTAILNKGTRNHIRHHSGEKAVACPHCKSHFVIYNKLKEHLERQKEKTFACGYCNSKFATLDFLRQHARGHISMHVCQFCDMTSPFLHSLMLHIRYRHLGQYNEFRKFKCHLCEYRAIQKGDLNKHLQMHEKHKNKKKNVKKSPKIKKDGKDVKRNCFVCHICTKGKERTYSSGGVLSKHLRKKHGMQIPAGHSRFKYNQHPDGKYRLTQCRYESLEVSKEVMKRNKMQVDPIAVDTDMKIKIIDKTPVERNLLANILVKDEDNGSETGTANTEEVEIILEDVDESGNIIKSVVYSMPINEALEQL